MEQKTNFNSGKDAKRCAVTPHLGKLFDTVLPALGHSTVEAIADIVDNSLDAQASTVHISLGNTNGKIDRIMIIDDGGGMERFTLVESYTFCTNAQHSERDLGKFGVGGTTACFTIARCKTTLTKRKDGTILHARQTVKDGMVTVSTADQAGIDFFNQVLGDGTGTIIILDDLKELDYKTAGALKNKIIKEFKHVYYHLLDDDKKIFISVGDQKPTQIMPEDPLYTDRPEYVEWSKEKDLTFRNHQISMRFVILKTELMDDSEKTYDDQGIYLSRNNRLIVRGGTLQPLWTKNPRRNRGRVEIGFSEELDLEFGISVTKNRAKVKQSLADFLKKEIDFFIKKCEEIYDSSSLSPARSENLAKEETIFEQKIINNAGVFGLPTSSKGREPAKISRAKKDATADKNTKNSNPKQSTVQTPRKRIGPKFEHVNEPKNSHDVYYSFGDDSDEMIIYINTGHPFIQGNYTLGTSRSKDVLRKIWAANCMAEHQHFGTKNADIIDDFRGDVARRLRKIQKVMPNK